MSTLHFLNVKEGDCSVIQHNSGRTSVIDVCNATPVQEEEDRALAALAKSDLGISGNFQQKRYPVNPIAYMDDHSVNEVWRYIQTHPDMDHMDGIKTFFDHFNPTVLWDTDNEKEMASPWNSSQYDEEDWIFYKTLRDTSPSANPKRLTNLSGDVGQYWNSDPAGGGGDGLHILAPTQTLVDEANEKDDYHRSSYVLLYRTGGSRIVFGGDSHDASWNHILDEHEASVTDIDLLIAPHHGRKSGRSYTFLDTLTPTLTFFGNAPHQHLAYGAWSSRGLQKITNNQANCMVVDCAPTPMVLYVTHENFARKANPETYYCPSKRAWYVGPIVSDMFA